MPNRYVKGPAADTRSIPHDFVVNFNYDILGNKTDNVLFIADCPMEITEIKCMPVVAGTDAGAVTAEIKKASGTTATGSGTAVATATFDLKSTIYTVQTATLSSTKSVRELASGDRIGVDFTGTLTAAEGFIQVRLKRIQGAGSEK